MRSPVRWLIIETTCDRRATETLMLELKTIAKSFGLDPEYTNVLSLQGRRRRKAIKEIRTGSAR